MVEAPRPPFSPRNHPGIPPPVQPGILLGQFLSLTSDPMVDCRKSEGRRRCCSPPFSTIGNRLGSGSNQTTTISMYKLRTSPIRNNHLGTVINNCFPSLLRIFCRRMLGSRTVKAINDFSPKDMVRIPSCKIRDRSCFMWALKTVFHRAKNGFGFRCSLVLGTPMQRIRVLAKLPSN